MAVIDKTKIKLTNPSDRTLAERNKFAGLVDNFATFTWRGADMFNEFGAFIINEKKGSLKMYNGASFKNSYSKTQFQDGYTNLSGVTFDTQTISFSIGVYWISIEDYRVLMNFLHPYEINMLSFGFDSTYGYMCKLQSVRDSTRYILGKEDSNSTGDASSFSRLVGDAQGDGYRYYTELNLTFDVIGAPCATEINPWIYNSIEPHNPDPARMQSGSIELTIPQSFITSDLDYPLHLKFPYVSLAEGATEGSLIAKAILYYPEKENPKVKNTTDLFEIKLKNLHSTEEPISIDYNSESGLLYWGIGDASKILTLLSSSSEGKRIVKSINVSQFFWPGRFSLPEIDKCVLTIEITYSNLILTGHEDEEQSDPYFSYYAIRRTNVL